MLGKNFTFIKKYRSSQKSFIRVSTRNVKVLAAVICKSVYNVFVQVRLLNVIVHGDFTTETATDSWLVKLFNGLYVLNVLV